MDHKPTDILQFIDGLDEADQEAFKATAQNFIDEYYNNDLSHLTDEQKRKIELFVDRLQASDHLK